MLLKKLLLALFFPLFLYQTQAQSVLPMARNLKPAYDKKTRSMDGRPGVNYWQNRASYDMSIQFDPATRVIKGTVNIDYVNNSPDTLKQIWFKLYPNLYKRESPRLSRVDSADLTSGLTISSLTINGKATEKRERSINGTNMTLTVPPLTKGQHMKFSIDYSYTLNKGSHNRTGEVDTGAHFIAYFFPRIAVYDDIDGWNKYPYQGTVEFYNDFCDFKVDITVPNDRVVWATGNLMNAASVLQPPILKKLNDAERSDQIITIIDSTEYASAASKNTPTNTWRFEASNVIDFAFACSNHYMWQASSVEVDKKTKRRTRADAVFNPAHKDYFWVAGDARKTVEAMSYSFPKWPFPYPHITVFDGLDQMEYPMMVNDNPVEDRHESIELTDHEIFHTMFPFYMGTNETKYAWMDEGWATIGEWLISPMIDSTIVDEYGVGPTSNNAGKETDLPIMTLSTEQSASYFTNSYPEPAMGYLYVKDLLGDVLFFKALHYYIAQWNGKHPIPYDFFNCMNTGSGKNLNWFWKRWFFDSGEPDLALTNVVTTGANPSVVVKAKGTKPVPIDLKITFSDQHTMTIHRSIAVWEKGATSVKIPLPTKRKIVKVELKHPHVPDTNREDNVWNVGGK